MKYNITIQWQTEKLSFETEDGLKICHLPAESCTDADASSHARTSHAMKLKVSR
jgi:hypothetical protein